MCINSSVSAWCSMTCLLSRTLLSRSSLAHRQTCVHTRADGSAHLHLGMYTGTPTLSCTCTSGVHLALVSHGVRGATSASVGGPSAPSTEDARPWPGVPHAHCSEPLSLGRLARRRVELLRGQGLHLGPAGRAGDPPSLLRWQDGDHVRLAGWLGDGTGHTSGLGRSLRPPGCQLLGRPSLTPGPGVWPALCAVRSAVCF